MKRCFLFFLIIILLFSAVSAQARMEADGLASPYKVIIDDEANLLTEAQEKLLLEQMMPISKYGTVVFHTFSSYFSSEENLARNYLDHNVSRDVNFSCTMLHINMGTRQLWIQSRGALLNTIGITNAYTITNAIAGKATGRQYYQCAAEGFSQIYTLIKGGRLTSPMRWICSILFAAALALLIAIRVVYGEWKLSVPAPVVPAVVTAINVGVQHERLVGQKKTYIGSDSSCSGGSSCGGGGSSCGGGGGSGF